MLSRLAYRLHQFRNSLSGSRMNIPDEALIPYLSPAQRSLFHRMQPSEQRHAFAIWNNLKTAGQTDPDLLAAALLHDVGKVLQPLTTAGRVLIVLGNRFFPGATLRWAAGTPRGLRLPFVVAAQHATWGAELAAQANATALTVELIRHHHITPPANLGSPTGHLLAALQSADDQN
jgi:hypothetical protein